MDFVNVTSWTIPEGSVTKVTDSNGNIIWQLNSDPHTPWYITATYYPITNTTSTKIMNTSSGVTLIEYNDAEYTPATYLKFSRQNENQKVKIYLSSPSVNVYTLFKGADRLKGIQIGKDINNVYKDGFSWNESANDSCVWFRTATVESGNSTYETRGNGIVHIGTNTLVVGGATTTIDSTIKTIGKGSLACVATGTDGAQKSTSDTSMPSSYIQLWDIPSSVTSLEEKAFWYTRKMKQLNVRGYTLRNDPDLPTNAFSGYGDSKSEIHIPKGTTLANTVWLNELVTTRGTGDKWTVCADL